MKIAGNRWINGMLTLLIVICLLVILHIFLIGGINIRVGDTVPGLGKVKLTANKLSNPIIVLLVLLCLKLCLRRPDPLGRLSRWLRRNRRAVFLALLITIAAGIPRLWGLETNSLNSDEILWIDRGQKVVYNLRLHEFKKATAHLGHPGVVPAALIGCSYIYLGHGTSTLSLDLMDRVTAARLPIALVGILTCVLVYAVGRIAFGEGTAFWGGVMLALYPAHIALSRVVHIDSTLTLFFCLSLLCYLCYAAVRRMSWKVASSISFGLALLTKSPAFLIPFALAVWKALARAREGRRSPRFWEVSDLGWLGLGLAVYFTFFTKLWYRPEELHWARFSHFLPTAQKLAFLIGSVGSLPWIPVTCGAALVCLLVLAVTQRRGGDGLFSWARLPLFLKGLLLVLLVLSFIHVFLIPITDELELASKVYRIEEKGHLKFWMGQLVVFPPRYFYPYMVMISTPPLALALILCGIARSCARIVRGNGRSGPPLMLLSAPVVFIGVMSAGHKMGYRYIAPAFPFLLLLAGFGLTGIIEALARRLPPEPARTRRRLHALAAAAVIGFMSLPLAAVAPHYGIYHNPLIGGPAGAARVLSAGWGIGTREAVEYLVEHAKEDDSVYALGLSSEFRFHWENREPAPAQDILINYTKPPHADWLVIPRGHRQRRREMSVLRLADSLSPVYTVNRCGIDFVTIYRLDDAPAAKGESYEAEDLRSDVGETVADDGASGGEAIRGKSPRRRGMLVYGPYRRLAKGRWRARFALGTGEGVKGNRPVARISVSGLSTRDNVSSREISPRDFGRGGRYRDFPLDFSLDRPRRIQFCVEDYGTAGIRADRVAVERID